MKMVFPQRLIFQTCCLINRPNAHTQSVKGFILHYNVTPVYQLIETTGTILILKTFLSFVYQVVYYIQYHQVFNIIF